MTVQAGESVDSDDPIMSEMRDLVDRFLARGLPLSESDWDRFTELSVVTVQRDAKNLEVIAGFVDELHGHLTRYRRYRLANKIAWNTRGEMFTLPQQRGPDASVFILYVEIERRRFRFDTSGIISVLSSLHPSVLESDTVLVALNAFCQLRTTGSADEAARIWPSVLDRHDVKEYREVIYDILAHAVWLNVELVDQGLILQEICDRWLSAETATPVLMFRYSAALRLQGKYLEAIKQVESALSRISGDSEFSRTFSEQCVRERELCVAGLSLTQNSSDIDRQMSDLNNQIREAERTSTTRIIEVITLFTAAAAFALGGITAVGQFAATPRALMILIGGFGAALVMFCLIVVVALEFSSGKEMSKPKMVWLISLVFGASAIQLVGTYLVAELAF